MLYFNHILLYLPIFNYTERWTTGFRCVFRGGTTSFVRSHEIQKDKTLFLMSFYAFCVTLVANFITFFFLTRRKKKQIEHYVINK